MPEDITPQDPEVAAISGFLPGVENLADSNDPDVIAARAKLLEAQAKLAKATTPLLDKIVLRGLLPIALAVVGPWALWQFDAARTEQTKQGEVIVELQTLLGDAKEEAQLRQERSAAWQERMGQIEGEKAAELTALATIVSRLDDMMKVALIQNAVNRVLEEPRGPSGMGAFPTRDSVIRDTAAQIQLPGIEEAEISRIAGQQYDRAIEQRKR